MLACNNVLQPCAACGEPVTTQKSRLCSKHQLSQPAETPPIQMVTTPIPEEEDEYTTIILGLEPDKDSPEHSIMGEVTENVLEAYHIPYWELKETDWQRTLEIALSVMNEQSLPVCLIVKTGVFGG